MYQKYFAYVRINVFTFANTHAIIRTVKEVNNMFQQLSMETIGYYNFMEQEDKRLQEEKERQEHDLRISQNEYKRAALRQRNTGNHEIL